jgi:radical SAM-linked protein
MIRSRIRLRFSKTGDLRLISHRDLVRSLERLFRRAGLPLGMSEGFHPRPRMMFPSALAIGVAALDEVMEVELCEELAAETVLGALRRHTPAGLEFHSAEILPPGTRKARVGRVRLEIPVPDERHAALRERMALLLSETTHLSDRGVDRSPIDLRSYIEHLSLDAGVLRLDLRVAQEGAARPREVLSALGLDDLEQLGFYFTRTAVELHTHEARNVDQRLPAGGVPDRDC